ncbi:MAG: amidohydrolase family protein [Nitrososphaerales archaeon]
MDNEAVVYSGPIIDVHFHPMLGKEPILGSLPHAPENYLDLVKGLDVRFIGSLTIAPTGDLTKTRDENDALLKLAKETNGRFFPVCSVHPLDGIDALQEIDRVASLGAKALKLHPNTQQFDVADPSVEQVVARASMKKLPVLFDAYSPFDANQAGKFVMLAMKVPEAKLILAHAHGNRFSDLLVYEILARYPWWKRNVWIDLSATANLLSESPFSEQFVWVLRKVGVDRLLFGSDYPLDNPRSAFKGVVNLKFTNNELERIFFGNASELLNLK